MEDLVVEATGLTKSYGQVAAVRGIDLSVEAGSVHGLLGPNGSGKSTTVRMLLSLARPDTGIVRLFGQPLGKNSPALLRRIGSLVEAPAFIPYLSGRDNLRLLETYRGRRTNGEVETALQRVNLAEAASRHFKDYSLGMKQRLGIAAAVLDGPDLIILDEPTNGLDPVGTREVRELIPALAADGHTVILCSHLLHEVEQVCDSVSIFNRGKIVRSGRVDDLVAGTTRLEVQVTETDRAIAVLLASSWGPYTTRDEDMIVIVGAGAAGAEINRLLGEQGMYASMLRPVQHTLEDVFMEVTEQPLSA